MADFQDRQLWDLDAWPEMYGKLKELQALILLAEPGIHLNLLVFTMASLAGGCRHCQAHGGLRARPHRCTHREDPSPLEL